MFRASRRWKRVNRNRAHRKQARFSRLRSRGPGVLDDGSLVWRIREATMPIAGQRAPGVNAPNDRSGPFCFCVLLRCPLFTPPARPVFPMKEKASLAAAAF